MALTNKVKARQVVINKQLENFLRKDKEIAMSDKEKDKKTILLVNGVTVKPKYISNIQLEIKDFIKSTILWDIVTNVEVVIGDDRYTIEADRREEERRKE